MMYEIQHKKLGLLKIPKEGVAGPMLFFTKGVACTMEEITSEIAL